METVGAAAPIKFALWRHLISPHTAMHVTPTSQNLPCPHKEKHLSALTAYAVTGTSESMCMDNIT